MICSLTMALKPVTLFSLIPHIKTLYTPHIRDYATDFYGSNDISVIAPKFKKHITLKGFIDATGPLDPM